MTRADLLSEYNSARAEYDRKLGEATAVEDMLEAYEEELSKLDAEHDALTQVVGIFGDIAGRLQTTFLRNVEVLVSAGLTSVFGQAVEFTIEQGTYGKQPIMDFRVSMDGVQSDDIINAHGGGLVALAGLIMRIVVVRLMRKTQAQVLVLDEPLAMLSAAYREAAAKLLSDLSQELGIQIIMVTHHQEYSERADKVITLEKKNGVAAVRFE